jgi:hypothetical protein
MRARVDRARLISFLDALGEAASAGAHGYLVGGATAILAGWRTSTVDVDLRLEPDSDAALRAIPKLKETLHINVELASPVDFLPEVPGWRERSQFLGQHGHLAVFHFDFYSQALAKIERGHDIDHRDIAAMLDSGLVERPRLLELFAAIEPQLYRFPAIDPAGFRRRVEAVCEDPK